MMTAARPGRHSGLLKVSRNSLSGRGPIWPARPVDRRIRRAADAVSRDRRSLTGQARAAAPPRPPGNSDYRLACGGPVAVGPGPRVRRGGRVAWGRGRRGTAPPAPPPRQRGTPGSQPLRRRPPSPGANAANSASRSAAPPPPRAAVPPPPGVQGAQPAARGGVAAVACNDLRGKGREREGGREGGRQSRTEQERDGDGQTGRQRNRDGESFANHGE